VYIKWRHQWGNFRNFLSLRFYVKSILGIVDVKNLPFLHCKWRWISILGIFQLSKSAKLESKFTPLKIVKMAVFEVLQSLKLISRKSSEISTQCGNYRNCLTRIFGKYFVKVTVLLSILLKSRFDGIFHWWERISWFPHCVPVFHTTVDTEKSSDLILAKYVEFL